MPAARRGPDMRPPSPRFMAVCFAVIIVILLITFAEGIYHAGWMDGFHECARIYDEARR